MIQEVELEIKKTKKIPIKKEAKKEYDEINKMIEDILNFEEDEFKIIEDDNHENEDEDGDEENESDSLLDDFKESFPSISLTTPRGFSYTTELKQSSELTYNRMEDLLKGEIYLVFNKKNGKKYIGKATCYTSKNNNIWGTNGRWKSHVNEALNLTKDHCRVLNQAIRKYSVDMFEVFMLVRVFNDELDFVEKHLITHYKTMTPHGYNLKTGGNDGKDSLETKTLKSESKTKRKSPTKKYEPGPISKETLKLAVQSQVFQQKVDRKIFILEKETLPENIDPIVNSGKLIGYKVKGLTDAEGKPYPSRNFIDKTNKWNLDNAYKFIDQISYYNQYNIRIQNIEKMHVQDRTKYTQDGYYLPEFINFKKRFGEVIGFCINGFKHKGYSNGKYGKVFSDSKKSLEEKYKDAVEFLDKLQNGEAKLKKRVLTKATYNGKELPKYLIVIYKDRDTKDEIQGFRINGFPLKKGEKKIHCSFTFKDYETLDEMFKEACKELERLHKLKDEQSK